MASECKSLSPQCPVELSIYEYQPSLAANAFFVGIFAVSCIVHVIQGWRYKTWTFMVAMTLGCLCESIGHVGRVLLHNNVFDDAAFKLQIVMLTFAPSFLSAGIYLMLKHLVLTFGADFSRLPAAWYTYIFISCDVLSIVLQGAGGAIASIADGPGSLMDRGNNIMMAGLAFQVFTLIIFGILSIDYFYSVWSHRASLNPSTHNLRQSKLFRAFVTIIAVAFFCILVRCIYRIVEMAGGWGNPIMRHEVSFIILDSVLCTVAAVVFNILHPGSCFNYKLLAKEYESVPLKSAGEDNSYKGRGDSP